MREVREGIERWKRSERKKHLDAQLYKFQMGRIRKQQEMTSNLRDFYHLFHLENRLALKEYDHLMRCSDLNRDRRLNKLAER